MRRLARYLLLPDEITRFEREYLSKMNHVAMIFFALHIPVFTTIAFFNGTGPLEACILTALGWAGPLLARRTLTNPRQVSVIFGLTAMFMGAVLVHFGRGLWTIEMHFYFFVALALLAVFANPMVVVAAAVTVALHHAVLWALAPQSLFNYDAPLSSVALHALFVVLESAAAIFVARSFFDNVIGLERIVADRTRALDQKNAQMKLVFDHVQQGFLTASKTGALSGQTSLAVTTWLEAPTTGEPVWSFFSKSDAAFGKWLELGWQTLTEEVFPREVALSQLPTRFSRGGRAFEVSYQPVEHDGALEQVLVLVSDITERLAREESDQVQRETVQVFDRVARDRAGFLEFFAEAKATVASLSNPTLSEPEQLRALHTLKGNCAVFGVSSVATRCHELETRIADRGTGLSDDDRAELQSWWTQASRRLMRFLGDGSGSGIQLDEIDYLAVLHAIDAGAPALEVRRLIASWKNEPVQARLERLAEQAQDLAERSGKAPLSVRVDAHGLRLPRERYSALWASFVHLVRNAIAHGLENSVNRSVLAKGPANLELTAARTREGLVLSVRDDGRGIDWEVVRAKAAAMQLPHAERSALVTDGFSTTDVATELSGRGVGLPAVRAAARALGGDLRVTSEVGFGTTFQCVLPWPEEVSAPPRAQATDGAQQLANA
jgi:two-component system, chemotaxis family, sensor kinase CheA